MRAYVYQAALLCESCGDAVKAKLDVNRPAHIDPDNESSYDSGEYPKGPYDNGGGEADCPQHCDHCQVFLENPLTTDGYAYVEEERREAAKYGMPEDSPVRTWCEFYEIDLDTGERA